MTGYVADQAIKDAVQQILPALRSAYEAHPPIIEFSDAPMRRLGHYHDGTITLNNALLGSEASLLPMVLQEQMVKHLDHVTGFSKDEAYRQMVSNFMYAGDAPYDIADRRWSLEGKLYNPLRLRDCQPIDELWHLKREDRPQQLLVDYCFIKGHAMHVAKKNALHPAGFVANVLPGMEERDADKSMGLLLGDQMLGHCRKFETALKQLGKTQETAAMAR